MMTETEDASLVFDLEAVLRADGDVFARWPLPQINPLDDVSTLASDTIGVNWMPTPKKSNTRMAPSTNQDIEQVSPKKQAPIKGDSRDGRTPTKRIYMLTIILGPVLIAVICVLAVVLARLRQEEVESSQSASWWDILPEPAPVPPPIDGGDDAPLPSPSTFPLAEPTRLPEEPATTTPTYPTNGPVPSSSASIPTDTPDRSTYAPLSLSPSTLLPSPSTLLPSLSTLLPSPSPKRPSKNTSVPTSLAKEPPSAPPSTTAPTLRPSNSPVSTMAPTNRPSAPTPQWVMRPVVPTLSPIAPTPSPSVEAPVSVDEIPYPDFRFLLWQVVGQFTREKAAILGYNEDTWNSPGTNDIESLSYETVELTLLGEIANAIEDIGYTETSWDCWVNHYLGYDWLELEQKGLTDVWVALGWDDETWQSDNENSWPDSDSTDWKDLTGKERTAAGRLCYTPKLWDKVPLPAW